MEALMSFTFTVRPMGTGTLVTRATLCSLCFMHRPLRPAKRVDDR